MIKKLLAFISILFNAIVICVGITMLKQDYSSIVLLLCCGSSLVVSVLYLKKPPVERIEVPVEIKVPVKEYVYIETPKSENANITSTTRSKPFVDRMSGVDFENFCVRMLSKNHFSNISTTQTSGDHGVDIIAWRAKRKFAIQCKRYENNVGNKAVQEVYTGKKLYGAGEAAVITNSHFTKQAEEEARELGVHLWDREKLSEMMRLAEIDDVIL